MQTIRFIMLGGFLGAGKTTAMARLAKHYMDQGRKVGIVTNDQAQDLVDTHSLREQGFPVEEVAGACFCCKFDDLLNRSARSNRPSIRTLSSQSPSAVARIWLRPSYSRSRICTALASRRAVRRSVQAQSWPEDSSQRIRFRVLAQGGVYLQETTRGS